ncbi:TIGR03364 family FAD-dependent oxidoreductase [Membranihabitans marinus]|uniref:TIGR03364 family FAD-dependent oxidoreductase n=1 Tax=Membranihabitans marinus TaxID=1227546 RepID=UPI001F031145|nr:TIGR03364 family FAD-dependent oxidoreductase [Membranihabitans marinus]
MVKKDVLVVGGGVLGSFHAYWALKQGKSVGLLEKDMEPRGSTVQNFGQVVPSGFGSKWQKFGRESLNTYRDIQGCHDIGIQENGSIYLASNDEEQTLLEELHIINQQNEYPSFLWSKSECLKKYPGLKRDYVKGGLFFPLEISINARQMIHELRSFLVEKMGLEYYGNTLVQQCEKKNGSIELVDSRGNVYCGDKVVICNGSDYQNLYPDCFSKSDIEISQLQMMQTFAQDPGFEIKGNILTGWSIRRYEAFAECPSYAGIVALEDEKSFQAQHGIHILFKQLPSGEVIIGDSHHYASIDQCHKLKDRIDMDIDNFMLAEARKIFSLPTFGIKHRWLGKYSQCKTKDVFQKTIDDDIHIVTAIGGKGMTASAGFAKYNMDLILA